MARLLINDGICRGGIFVPGQLFAFGSVVLHANPTGHLDQVDSFTPEHEIRFGNLEYVADARGDLIFTGFSTLPEGPDRSEALTSDPPHAFAPAPGPVSDLTSSSDPPPAPEDQELCLAEYTPDDGASELDSGARSNTSPADLSFLNGMLDRIQKINIVDGPSSDQEQVGHEANCREFRVPPTAHLVATVEDLTDMLDYASDEDDYMDEDLDVPPITTPSLATSNTGKWTATSSYDVYMVDTPAKDGDTTKKDGDGPTEEPPKRPRR
jgi:hypothetical protein